MALEEDAMLTRGESVPIVDEEKGQSSSRLRPSPQHSDIRELDVRHPEPISLEASRAFEFGGSSARYGARLPPNCAFNQAVESYGRQAKSSPQVLHALRIGDLELAVASLIQENVVLQQELDASQADFAAILAMNREIQEQSHQALGNADDQRIALHEELERALGAVWELELQLAKALSDSAIELAEAHQHCDSLGRENLELVSKLESLKQSA